MNIGRNTAARRILIAMGVSLFLHTIALSRFGLFSANELSTQNGLLQISLVRPEAIPAVTAEAKPPSAPGASSPPPERVVPIKLPEPHKPPATPPAPVKPAEAMAAVSTSAKPSSPPVREAPQTNQMPGIPFPGLAGPVKRAEIEFEVFAGADRKEIGRGRYVYESVNGESYGLSIKQTFKTEEAVQMEPWQLEISGNIIRQGLNPLIFRMQGVLPERLMALSEVPESASISQNKSRSGRMPDGILDRQSLLYQFMHQPPALMGGEVSLTNGVMHGLYTYRVAGLELLNIASIGGVRTMKLVFSTSESTETIELWLVPDMHYLPAKVRHTDRQGVITEQVVTSLNFK